jgi:hypothetical protein
MLYNYTFLDCFATLAMTYYQYGTASLRGAERRSNPENNIMCNYFFKII